MVSARDVSSADSMENRSFTTPVVRLDRSAPSVLSQATKSCAPTSISCSIRSDGGRFVQRGSSSYSFERHRTRCRVGFRRKFSIQSSTLGGSGRGLVRGSIVTCSGAGEKVQINKLDSGLKRLKQDSWLLSVVLIYAIDLPDEAFTEEDGYVPWISLQHPYTIGWTIANALIIVRISEHLTLPILQNILSNAVDIEKVLLVMVVDLNTNTNEQFFINTGQMLLRRGLLNYCVLTHNFSNVQPTILKYDALYNHIRTYDLNSSVETIFPTFLRTLAGRKLNALLSDNYPYAYVLAYAWEGMDAYILTLVKYRFQCEVKLINMVINRNNALHRMDMIRQQLANGTIDIHMPRAHVAHAFSTIIGVARAYEWEALVLVVPKSDQLNLTNIMLQPFSIEVWSMVLCYLLMKQLFKLLSFLKRHCTRFRMARIRCRWSSSLGSVSIIGVELVSFLLIEAYLAKITEFLLYCRFRSDPRTLDEFFQSDILVLIPEYMDPLVDTLDSEVAAQFRTKCVRPDAFAKMSASCCARIHTLPRAEYIVRMEKYFDTQLGRKQLYILPEYLKIIPMSYLLGKSFAFKNSFELFLLQVYENGLMQQYIGDAGHPKLDALHLRQKGTEGLQKLFTGGEQIVQIKVHYRWLQARQQQYIVFLDREARFERNLP
uniref:Uncharacterized protein n=1 Tax=Anopheles culicifacies TaxID=139723 RepID=A0A182MIS6_9DIPT